MTLDQWPQILFLVLITLGLYTQYRKSLDQFKKTCYSAAAILFILYCGDFFDNLINEIILTFGGRS